MELKKIIYHIAEMFIYFILLPALYIILIVTFIEANLLPDTIFFPIVLLLITSLAYAYSSLSVFIYKNFIEDSYE